MKSVQICHKIHLDFQPGYPSESIWKTKRLSSMEIQIEMHAPSSQERQVQRTYISTGPTALGNFRTLRSHGIKSHRVAGVQYFVSTAPARAPGTQNSCRSFTDSALAVWTNIADSESLSVLIVGSRFRELISKRNRKRKNFNNTI